MADLVIMGAVGVGSGAALLRVALRLTARARVAWGLIGLAAALWGTAQLISFSILARHPDIVKAMQEARWEIASHGLKWIDYKDAPEAEERAHFVEAMRIHTQVTGERPYGWYTGRNSVNTLKAILDEDRSARAPRHDAVTVAYTGWREKWRVAQADRG